MNCRRAEKWLLLREAGELAPRKRLRLEKHLAGCAPCRAYRADLERVLAAARRSLPAGAPAAQTLAAIREAARAEVAARPAAARSWNAALWNPALAAAAIILLCLGGWYWLAGRLPYPVGPSVAWEQPAVKPGSPAGADSDDLAALLLEDVVMIEPISDVAGRQELSALDRDLLLIEGLAI